MTNPRGPRQPDRFDIKAAVQRGGETLTSLALKAGLSEAACRQGLLGVNRKGAQVIADFLGRPFRELFPDQYVLRRHSEQSSLNDRSHGSAKVARGADKERGAA